MQPEEGDGWSQSTWGRDVSLWVTEITQLCNRPPFLYSPDSSLFQNTSVEPRFWRNVWFPLIDFICLINKNIKWLFHFKELEMWAVCNMPCRLQFEKRKKERKREMGKVFLFDAASETRLSNMEASVKLYKSNSEPKKKHRCELSINYTVITTC